jgi:hypothetical protein
MGWFGTAGTVHGKEVNTLTRDVMEWLRSHRKLDGELLKAMGVRAYKHEHLGDSVAFPYRVNGETKAAKFRQPGALQHRRAFVGSGSAHRDYRGRD